MIHIIDFASLVAGILFILSLRWLSSAATSLRGNTLGCIGMIIAVAATFAKSCSLENAANCGSIALAVAAGGGIGYFIAKKIDMTSLPQLVAAFHSLVGLAAVLIACAVFYSPGSFGIALNADSLIPAANAIEMSLGAAIGAVTLTGSVIAAGKLQGLIKGKPLHFKGQHITNLAIALCILVLVVAFTQMQSEAIFTAIVLAALVLGYLLVMPIGGADMPVIVSMLNSYSGWAAAGIGFTLENNLLIIAGALVGTSGAILSSIMCRGMNRSLLNVILGGKGSGSSSAANAATQNSGSVKLCSPEDAAFLLGNADSVIIVPGYGMAVSQAQHVVGELARTLKNKGASVKYAIHPVAGRMPGHMNVLLAEANIPYDDVFELDEINHEFGSTDVAIVIGANDITNPAAKTDPASPIYGMPVLDVDKARTVLFVKRSLGAGYAGIDNSLFYQNNTMMILGEAKKVCEEILKSTS